MNRNAIALAALVAISSYGVAAQHADHKKMTHGQSGTMMSHDVKIREALSAAPADIAMHAAVMDWPDKEGGPMQPLRPGTNGWTCMPSSPMPGAAKGADPMCFDKTFSDFGDAWMSKKAPEIKNVGVA